MLPGGCPVIDIGPPGTNYAAVVWTQGRGESLNDVTIAVVDNRFGWATLDETGGEEEPGSCLGSIAVHNDSSGDIRSSISFFHTDSIESEDWLPYAIYIEADPNGGEATWADEADPLADDIFGEWDVASFENHYYGMNTALTVFDNYYWMVWSGYQIGSTPDEVWGTFGYTY
jgi:hypothetical protein